MYECKKVSWIEWFASNAPQDVGGVAVDDDEVFLLSALFKEEPAAVVEHFGRILAVRRQFEAERSGSVGANIVVEMQSEREVLGRETVSDVAHARGDGLLEVEDGRVGADKETGERSRLMR